MTQLINPAGETDLRHIRQLRPLHRGVAGEVVVVALVVALVTTITCLSVLLAKEESSTPAPAPFIPMCGRVGTRWGAVPGAAPGAAPGAGAGAGAGAVVAGLGKTRDTSPVTNQDMEIVAGGQGCRVRSYL